MAEDASEAREMLAKVQRDIEKNKELVAELRKEQEKLKNAMMSTKRRIKEMKTDVVRQKTLQVAGRSTKKPTTQGETPIPPQMKMSFNISSDLSPEQIEGFKESFAMFDVDNDGQITTQEVYHVLETLGKDVTEDVYGLVKELEGKNQGVLDFDDFIKVMVAVKKMYASDDYEGTLPIEAAGQSFQLESNLGKAIDGLTDDANLDDDLRDFAASGNVKGMEALIKRGANVNATSEKTGFSALHRACAENQVNAVAFLLKQPGIEKYMKSKFGMTPIQLASTEKQQIQFLFEQAEQGEGRLEVLTSVAAMASGPLPHPLGDFHVYVSHVYAEHQKAVEVQKGLEELGVKVFCPNKFINTEEQIEKDLGKCDLAVVMVTSQFLRNMGNERSGIFKEFEIVKMIKADVEREIIYVIADSSAGRSSELDELPGFRDTKTFDMRNSKEINENMKSLYQEIDTRLSM